MGSYIGYQDIEDLYLIPISSRDKIILRNIYLIILSFWICVTVYFFFMFYLLS